MKLLLFLSIAFGSVAALETASFENRKAVLPANEQYQPAQFFSSAGDAINSPQTEALYRLDPAQSKFMVHAFRGGVLWFKGHDHFIKIGDFSGEVKITPSVINPASLVMTIRADSLEETGANFTAQQKQIIKKELNEIVLETAKYPEITFRSTNVTGKFNGSQFEARIGGEMTLHGTTRPVVVPASVSLEGNDLRARGEFSINRKDFNVTATNAFHGLVRVRHKLKFTFDIVAHRG